MAIHNLHPAVLGLLGAFMLIIFYGRAKPYKLITIVVPLIMAYLSLNLQELNEYNILGLNFIPVKINLGARLFACVFSIALITGCLYAYSFGHYLEIILSFFYASGALIITFAGDWLVFFLALESMVIASAMIIFFGESDENKIYARRYFLIHIFAGTMILSGFILVSDSLGTREIMVLTNHINYYNKTGFGSTLILLGLLINIGMPPFADWVNDCYAAASAPGNVLLNTYTTKVSIFMLASVFKGLEILVYLGIIMQLYGIIYAILEDKFRKALNSATILIIGMMVVGVGLGSKNVLIGTSILACSHIFYKQLLIMIAGLAEKNLFTDRFSKAAKIIMDSKLLIASSIIAYLGLISFPGSASFIGKSIIISELAYFNQTLYEILLLISSLIFFIIPISKFNGLETEANQQSNYLTHSKCESESLFLLLAINLIFSLGIYPLYNMNFFGDNVILKQLEWKQISAQFSLLSAGMLLYLIFRHQDLKTTHDLISTNYCYNVFNLPTNDIIEWKNKKIKNFTEKLKFVSYKIQSGAAHINNLDMAGQLIFVIIVINLMIILM